MLEIDPETLSAILECDTLGLMPLTAEQRMKAALDVRLARRSATPDDPDAIAFRARLRAVEQILRDDVRKHLAEVPILWIESSLPHAAAIQSARGPALLVCRGLFDVVHFQTSLISVGSLLSRLETETDESGETLSPSHLLNLAGHIALVDAYENLWPPVTIADMLGPRAAKDVELGVSTSLLLLILHELGHVALGHTTRVDVGGAIQVDIVPHTSSLSSRRSIELAADAYSVEAVIEKWRSELLSSLLNLHNVFHFLEIFGLQHTQEYPSADERLSLMISKMGLGHSEQAFADSWLSDYRHRQAMISANGRTPVETLRRFAEVMDSRAAYKALDRIRRDLAASGIVLDYD
ncbi:hypothetical protein [Hoeflea olei]|uniref:Uncharacterized protein n=1 Tax=Hoeflea olei TaxID=1480615 RepID=A0A1C1Z1E8_9HYPH|nr:hypothetical protein [Hoeflea olei]OCW59581.1 hypothetical protein AWJ14_11285 [Hoeflea olei]